MKSLVDIIDATKAQQDKNGIWVSELVLSKEVETSKKAWDEIYDFNVDELKRDIEKFKTTKLQDHLNYILPTYAFDSSTVYLEIGCGPSYIGEYLLREKDCFFVGVDFNYPMLISLKKFLDEQGYTKYILIHADINHMPIKENTIDYVYGGGVIEHLPDTAHILKELWRVLKPNGVSFNTIPAFNLWWLTRPYNNIPSLPVLKQIFEFIHITLLKNKVLEAYYGYELSYIPPQLHRLHTTAGFQNVKTGAFAFSPDPSKLQNTFLRSLYRIVSSNIVTCPVYYVEGTK